MRNVQTSKRPNVQMARTSVGISVVAGTLCVFMMTGTALAQSIDQRLDEQEFLRGLAEYELPELIEHYFRMHPPADELTAIEQQIALDRLLAQDRARPIDERERAVQCILEHRERLIEQSQDSRRRAILLAEQASDIYFELLALDATAISTIFGVPSDAQRECAQDGVRRLYETAMRAEAAVDEALLDLEADADFLHDPALREERRRMAMELRDRRVPFLLGLGTAMHATISVEDEVEQARLADDARRVLEPLHARLDGSLAAQAMLAEAIALLLLEQFPDARERFSAIREDQSSDALTRFAAQVGEVLILRRKNSYRSAIRVIESLEDEYRGQDALFYQLMLADQRSLIARERGAPDAFDAYLALLDRSPREQADVVRQAVFDRLRRMDDPAVVAADLPPLVQIAQADRRGATSEERPDAIRRVQVLLDRGGLDDREHEMALFVLARLLQFEGDSLEAGRRWVELARRFEYSPEAERAIERGVALLADQYRAQPQQAAGDLSEALNLMLRRFPNLPRIHRWRFLAGQVALRERRYDEAMEHFSRIPRGAVEWFDARFQRIETMQHAAAAAQAPGDRTRRYQQLIDEAQEAMAVLRNAASEERDQHRRSQLHRYEVLIALHMSEAHVALDAPNRSMSILNDLDAAAFEDDASVTARWLQARIRAIDALDRPEEARDVLGQFVEAAPERAASILAPMVMDVQRRVELRIAEHRHDEARELAQSDLLPLAQVIERWIEQRGEANALWSLRVSVADAHRYAGELATALTYYERLQREQPNAVSVLLGRAECLYHLAADGDDPRLADAMHLYRRLVAAGERLGHDVYWQSQLRTLQILERTGRNTHQIVPHIQRLREQHPDLGGDRFRREFDRLQRDA